MEKPKARRDIKQHEFTRAHRDAKTTAATVIQEISTVGKYGHDVDDLLVLESVNRKLMAIQKELKCHKKQ